MKIGRWYPRLVTLADGDLFVASGVQKLLKPVYPDRPFGSGTNVTETETYDVGAGTWTDNGAAAKRSLPLYPRLHLLPNGNVYYDAAGQSFNPFGQSYDMALWNIAAAYDPTDQELDRPRHPGPRRGLDRLAGGLATLAGADHRPAGARRPGPRAERHDPRLPGLDLLADAAARAGRRRRLHRGQLPHRGRRARHPVASPGSYVATSDSRITTVDTAGGDSHDRPSPPATSRGRAGTDRRPAADRRGRGLQRLRPRRGRRARGRVPDPPGRAVRPRDARPGGRSPQATSRGPTTTPRCCCPTGASWSAATRRSPPSTSSNITVPGGFGPNDGRDPSFEVFKPPYLFRGPRPRITDAPKRIRTGADVRDRGQRRRGTGREQS